MGDPALKLLLIVNIAEQSHDDEITVHVFCPSKMPKMLRGAQRNQSEEDSSGSDSGSEVSLEPETDRFGFILTNGSTAE